MCEVRAVSQQLWWQQWLRQCHKRRRRTWLCKLAACTVTPPYWQQETAQDERKQRFHVRSCLFRLERWGWRRLRAGRSAADHAAAVRGQPGAVCGHVRRLQARHQLRHPLPVQRQHLPVHPCVQERTRQ